MFDSQLRTLVNVFNMGVKTVKSKIIKVALLMEQVKSEPGWKPVTWTFSSGYGACTETAELTAFK